MEYFVSLTGSDGAMGTLARPFQTIQKAASVMVAGDTAYIRAGIYRETVTPKNSGTQNAPITYTPYNGESVTISGADVIPASSWTLSSANIYKAPMSWNLGEGANQVFLGGQIIIEARWPNTTFDFSHPIVDTTTSGSWVRGDPLSTGTITASDLPSRPAGYWNGTRVNILLGSGWAWQTGTVIDSPAANSQLSFTFSEWLNVADSIVPSANNPFYLWGKFGELDSPGEWYFDALSHLLYFWTPATDSPAQHSFEVKRRQNALNLSCLSFITIQGLNVFAANIISDAKSSYLLLDGLNAQYSSLLPKHGSVSMLLRRPLRFDPAGYEQRSPQQYHRVERG